MRQQANPDARKCREAIHDDEDDGNNDDKKEIAMSKIITNVFKCHDYFVPVRFLFKTSQ